MKIFLKKLENGWGTQVVNIHHGLELNLDNGPFRGSNFSQKKKTVFFSFFRFSHRRHHFFKSSIIRHLVYSGHRVTNECLLATQRRSRWGQVRCGGIARGWDGEVHLVVC